MFEEAYLSGRGAYATHSQVYERVLGVMRKVYEKAKAMFPNHPLDKKIVG